MLIYSIFDKKVSSYRSPFFADSDTVAVRAVYREANDNRSDINLFPSDFALYRHGEFNSDIGNVSGFTPVEFVCECSDLIKPDKTESN